MKKKLTQNKKSVLLKPPTIISCCLVVFFISAMFNYSIAQTISSNPAYKPAQKAVPVAMDNTKETPPVVIVSKTVNKKTTVKDLPYYNYKGISDLDQAKAAWIADNPEEYQKMLEQPVIQIKPSNVANQQNVIVSDQPSSIGSVLPQSRNQLKKTEKIILHQVRPSNIQVSPQDYNDGSIIIKSNDN